MTSGRRPGGPEASRWGASAILSGMTDTTDPIAQRPVVLASSSPRRRVLLGQLGVRFTVRISDLDETLSAPVDAATFVASLARQKAERVAWEGQGGDVPQPDTSRTVVLGADTVVSLDGEILGKPADAAAAAAMLRRLRGRDHDVYTAVALVDTATGTSETRLVRTTVHVRDFTDAALDAYVATGEPLDKAGGYGIQRGTRELMAGFTGCYTNVVGFPVCEVAALLIGAGLALPGEPPYCRLPDGRPCPHAVTMTEAAGAGDGTRAEAVPAASGENHVGDPP